jgi:hypothetical protein
MSLAILLSGLFVSVCVSHEKTPSEEYTDSMWRQGYGFNNPRIRKGEPPVDFDGTVHDDGWHWGNLFGK